MKILFALFLTLPFLWGFGSQHSSLETAVKSEDKELTFSFKITANEGMQLTHQAPWSVSISDSKGLDLPLSEGKYTTKEYQKDLPGFVVKTKATEAKAGQIKFILKAFVCTQDKKQCFPQSHKGSLDWKI